MKNSEYILLLVDDEPDILEFVSYNLKKEGFTVHTTKNGKDALKKAIKIKPHLILLDVMMPEMDGIETCEELRKIDYLQNTIIAMLTARGEDYSQIAGFEAGADDYITKPIKPKVLISKIKALLKRTDRQISTENTAPNILEINDIQIDLEKFLVISNNQEHNLPKKEFKLLYLLASKPGKVFTREEIYSTIWGDSIIVGDRTIDVHIRKLREKLGDKCIKTVKGVGYKFIIS